MSDAPAPHYTVDEIARQDDWYVYRVEPVGQVRMGTCHDLTCEAAVVRERLGRVSRFCGTSKVVLRALAAQRDKSARPTRRALAERALGATVQVTRGKTVHTGQIIFADYDSLNVLVAAERVELFASLNEVTALSRCTKPINATHGVRLNPWRYGSGWEGCELNRFERDINASQPIATLLAA